MRLLVLGGTAFLGRAITHAALARGHEVTTFNRGITDVDVPGVRALRGDRSRTDGAAILAGRAFDAAIDPGGLVPMHVLRTVRAIARSVPFYAYVSSLSAYQNWRSRSVDEWSPLQDCPPDEDGEPDAVSYGPRKAGCERAVGTAYGPRERLIVRPGTIVGSRDNVGQLAWWLGRIAAGGTVLAPGDPDQGLQILDVRDLADFVLDLVEHATAGSYNAVPAGTNTTMGELLDACRRVTAARAEFVWVPDEALIHHEAPAWIGVPYWVPADEADAGMWTASGHAAAAAGLRVRPVLDTVADTWEWLRAGGEVTPMAGLPPIGLDRDLERRILAAHRSSPAATRDGPQ